MFIMLTNCLSFWPLVGMCGQRFNDLTYISTIARFYCCAIHILSCDALQRCCKLPLARLEKTLADAADSAYFLLHILLVVCPMLCIALDRLRVRMNITLFLMWSTHPDSELLQSSRLAAIGVHINSIICVFVTLDFF